jgi:CHAT domain-containing protein
MVLLLACATATQAATPGGSCRAPGPAPAQSEAGAALERGNSLLAKGDVEDSLAAYARSEELARAGGDADLAMLARANAARARIDSGQREGLAPELDALLAAAAKLSDPVARARLRIHLARSLAELARSRAAAEVLIQAAQDAQGSDRRLESYAQGYLAELYERAGRREDAVTLARRALFSAQRAEAPDAVYRWQWLLARLQRAAGDDVGAIETYRSAVGTLRGVPELGGSELEALYLGFVDLLLASSDGATAPIEQARLAEARSALEDLEAGELRDYFRDPCLDAQRKSAPDTVPGALVVYSVPLPDRLELIAGREGRLSRHVVDVDRGRYTAAVRDFRRLVEKRTTRRFLRPASDLYEWLIRPLDLEGVETFVLVSRGVTRALPLAALYDSQAGEFLIEKLPVAITPGLTLTEPRPIDRGKVRVLAAGVSETVQGYPALANVRVEIDALQKLFETRSLLDGEFATARFEEEVRENVFDVVHVASHGEFLPTASESYLLTYDGRIPMDELGKYIGKTRFRERGLELLTLSACRTAAGDDRAALGLAGVALRAGARSALATLWAVNDRVSGELMKEFYVRLSKPGVSRARALQAAQLEVLKTRAYRHPGYWAPFVMISNWL